MTRSGRPSPGPGTTPGTIQRAAARTLAVLDRPLVTAIDQPPAPGSGWLARLWGSSRRTAARVLATLPQRPSVPVLLLRIVAVLVLWAVVVAVLYYAIGVWVILRVLGRGRSKRTTVPVGPPSTAQPWNVAPDHGAADAAAELRRRLATAPDPAEEAAVDECPTCGAPTARTVDECRYCRFPLPVVSRRGWHPDPLGGEARRWFDGRTWTEFTTEDVAA